MSEKETYEICNEVDSFIARELTESIIHKVSYDMLEAHYGILPISRRRFLPEAEHGEKINAAEDVSSGRRKERTVYDCMGKGVENF